MVSDPSAGDAVMGGLNPFTKLTKASVEALRYRGEDVEKSLTKNAIKEASLLKRPPVLLLRQRMLCGDCCSHSHLLCACCVYISCLA